MKDWKLHLGWAIVTPLLALIWGQWTAARQEQEVQVRERDAEARPGNSPARNEQTPAPKSDTPPPRPPSASEPASEEQAYVDEIRRLFRSSVRADHWEASRRLVRIPRGPVMNELILDQLACPEETLRYSAISNLAAFMKAESVPLLVNVLKNDPDWGNRSLAAGHLGKYGGPSEIAPLLEAVHDREHGVQVAAAGSLRRLGQPGPAEELSGRIAERLGNPDGAVRREVVYDLGRLGVPSAVPVLIRCLTDSNGDVRSSASSELAEFEDPKMYSTLEALLKDPNPLVAEGAQAAIERYKMLHKK